MKKMFLFLATGFEELEAIAVLDVLRRGNMEVRTVAVGDSREVTGAHGVTVVADVLLASVLGEKVDCLVFPGGMPGAKNLGECGELMAMLQHHYDAGGYVAAICAAPALVLSQLKAGRRLRVTCYPGFEDYLPEADVLADGVVIDGKVITGKGPGFAIPFGLGILAFESPENAEEVAAGMLL